MKWKILFWAYIVMNVIGLGTLVLTHSPLSLNFAVYEGLIEGIVLTIATYSYAYKRKIFPAAAWKFLFAYLVILWALQIFIQVVPIEFLTFIETNIYSGLEPIITSIILSVPAMIAMYRLGAGKQYIQ